MPINMKCCDLIGAATIVAARTSEVCVSHQTLLQRAPPTNQKSEHVKGSGYARLACVCVCVCTCARMCAHMHISMEIIEFWSVFKASVISAISANNIVQISKWCLAQKHVSMSPDPIIFMHVQGYMWHMMTSLVISLSYRYTDRRGITIGDIMVLVETKKLLGTRCVSNKSGPKGALYLEKQWSSSSSFHPYQTIIMVMAIIRIKYIHHVTDVGSVVYPSTKIHTLVITHALAPN